MRKYKSLKEVHEDLDPVIKSGMPLSPSEWENVVKETIRLLKEKKK